MSKKKNGASASPQNSMWYQTTPQMMLWPTFIVLMVAGISAFMIFPVQAGYGLIYTIVFRLVTVVLLVVVVYKFFGNIRKI